MIKKSTEAPYAAPELDVHEVATEAGFAQTLPTQNPLGLEWDDLLS